MFLGNHPLVMITQRHDSADPVGTELLYPYFGMHRIDWYEDGDEGTEFNLTISDWVRLFNAVGFEIVAYHELQSPTTGDEVRFYASMDWAHTYPTEQVWVLRKRS